LFLISLFVPFYYFFLFRCFVLFFLFFFLSFFLSQISLLHRSERRSGGPNTSCNLTSNLAKSNLSKLWLRCNMGQIECSRVPSEAFASHPWHQNISFLFF
jgi:hypothetical protein